MPAKSAVAKALAKAKAKAAASAQPRGEKRPRSAIDEAEDVPARKKLAIDDKSSFDFDVEKALTDNFKGFTDFQMRMVLDADGKSIEDGVRERKQATMLDPKVTCGKSCYNDLKEGYFGTSAGMGVAIFQEHPDSDVQDDQLYNVLKASIRHN